MLIEKNTVVSIHYTLKDARGEVLDSSAGGEPLVYLHGAKNIITGLEEALDGRQTGDEFNVTIPPEKAYGERDEQMVQRIPKSQFPDPDEIAPGMRFQANSPQGMVILTVMEVLESDFVVDGNPELAGQTLYFEVKVADVRPATAEEQQHGHAHGPGGHHHH